MFLTLTANSQELHASATALPFEELVFMQNGAAAHRAKVDVVFLKDEAGVKVSRGHRTAQT
jgi:hypothetical protein